MKDKLDIIIDKLNRIEAKVAHTRPLLVEIDKRVIDQAIAEIKVALAAIKARQHDK